PRVVHAEREQRREERRPLRAPLGEPERDTAAILEVHGRAQYQRFCAGAGLGVSKVVLTTISLPARVKWISTSPSAAWTAARSDWPSVTTLSPILVMTSPSWRPAFSA